MGKSKIEWTEVTWNPVLGCSKVSQGCKNCYAMSMSARIANSARDREDPTEIQQGYMDVVKQDDDGKYLPKWNNKIALLEGRLDEPLRWQKPRRVFVNSMSDLFHPDVPFAFIDKVFAVMALAEDHIFQILTKRPDRMAEYLNDQERDVQIICQMDKFSPDDIDERGWLRWPLHNVWLGTSCEDQGAADYRIPYLLDCPAEIRFISCEPLLGPLNFRWKDYAEKAAGQSYREYLEEQGSVNEYESLKGIDWVIVGGESGHNARPMHPDWARSLRDQCQEAGVSFFFKQWGKFVPGNAEIFPKWLDDNYSELNPEWGEYKEVMVEFEQGDLPWVYFEAPQKVKWRKIDGREWNQMPNIDTEVDHV